MDRRLGSTFSVAKDISTGIITFENEIKYKTIETDTYLLLSGPFVLLTTMEYFSLSEIFGIAGHKQTNIDL